MTTYSPKPESMPAGRISEALGETLPHEHLINKNRQELLERIVSGSPPTESEYWKKILLNRKPYSEQRHDKENGRIKGLRVGCISCDLEPAWVEWRNVFDRIEGLTKDTQIVYIKEVFPFGYSGPDEKRTKRENNLIKLLITADYLRLLLRLQQIEQAYSQAPDAYAAKEGSGITARFLIAATNCKMARFMIKRWGFSAANENERKTIETESEPGPFYLSAKTESVFKKIPELVGYLEDLKKRTN